MESVRTITTGMKTNKNACQENVRLEKKSWEMVNVKNAQSSTMSQTTRKTATCALVDQEKSVKQMAHAKPAKTTSSLEPLERTEANASKLPAPMVSSKKMALASNALTARNWTTPRPNVLNQLVVLETFSIMMESVRPVTLTLLQDSLVKTNAEEFVKHVHQLEDSTS